MLLSRHAYILHVLGLHGTALANSLIVIVMSQCLKRAFLHSDLGPALRHTNRALRATSTWR